MATVEVSSCSFKAVFGVYGDVIYNGSPVYRFRCYRRECESAPWEELAWATFSTLLTTDELTDEECDSVIRKAEARVKEILQESAGVSRDNVHLLSQLELFSWIAPGKLEHFLPESIEQRGTNSNGQEAEDPGGADALSEMPQTVRVS